MSDLRINSRLSIPLSEIDLSAIRSQGPGGQNVNKVASAIHLRFEVEVSSLPEREKAMILAAGDSHMTESGVIIIKAQAHRSQARNRQDALKRLAEIIRAAMWRPKVRRPTAPSRAARQRRLTSKARRSDIKSTRSRIRRGQVRDFD